MNKLKTKNIFFWFSLVLTIITGLSSCQTTKAINAEPKSNDQNWTGVYTGIIPSASGMGIDVRITLNSDNTFELRYQYVGKDDDTFIRIGTFTLNETGDLITLNSENTSRYYR